MRENSITPYLIIAFYTWAIDSGVVPILEVQKNPNNIVPDYLKDKEKILFSIHPDSVTHLAFGKKNIQFYAKIKGSPFYVTISNDAVSKIFRKDNGNGLEFNEMVEVAHVKTENEDVAPDRIRENPPKKKKSNLILVKK